MKPLVWYDADRVLLRMGIPADAFASFGAFAVALLGCPESEVVIEYGPRRAIACEDADIEDPATTVLFIRKPKVRR